MRFREQFEHHKILEWYLDYFEYDRLKDGNNYFRKKNHRIPLLTHQNVVKKETHGHQDRSGYSSHEEVSNS
jgi:hypothetical protein